MTYPSGEQPETQELDEILGIELKDYGARVLRLTDVNKVKQAILARHEQDLAEAFQNGYNSAQRNCSTFGCSCKADLERKSKL